MEWFIFHLGNSIRFGFECLFIYLPEPLLREEGTISRAASVAFYFVAVEMERFLAGACRWFLECRGAARTATSSCTRP